MRIDTDLVTYLSHVILPEQLVRQQLQNTQMLHHLQMQMVDDAKQNKLGSFDEIEANEKQIAASSNPISYAAEDGDNS